MKPILIFFIILIFLALLFLIINYKNNRIDFFENFQKKDTLVIILSETRAYELTFDNVKKNLIDELDADVCLCIGTKSDYNYSNPFYKIAKYKFLYDENKDINFHKALEYAYSEIIKYNTNCIHYSEFIKYKKYIAGENDDPTHYSNFLISTGIHIFFLWFLQLKLKENDLINKYKRFVIIRSDMMYTLPHPQLDLLDKDNIWILDDEHYGGYCDRHVVLSQSNILQYINILENMFINSNKYITEIIKNKDWNMEKLLKLHFDIEKIDNIKQMPYIMYSVRSKEGTSRWAMGTWSEELGYYIKYMNEYNKSKHYKELYEKSNTNISDFYKSIIIK
jgi:hypothetical protein